jgi:aldose 1-epimerase
MDPICLTNESDGVRCLIDHRRGASILRLEADIDGRRVPLISRNVPGEDPSLKPGCFIMAPWTNRIAGAAFTFNARRHALRPSAPDGTAIHGDVRARPFRIVERTPVSALLEFDAREHAEVNFPWPFVLGVRYELDGPALCVELELTNTSDEAFPAALGLHPYFPREPVAACPEPLVAAPCRGRYPTVRMLPTGPARRDALTRRLSAPAPLPPQHLDEVFDGFGGQAGIDWGRFGLEITASPELDHLVLFAPLRADRTPEPYFAIEPVSAANDAFNLASAGARDVGARTLEPGDALRAACEFRIIRA